MRKHQSLWSSGEEHHQALEAEQWTCLVPSTLSLPLLSGATQEIATCTFSFPTATPCLEPGPLAHAPPCTQSHEDLLCLSKFLLGCSDLSFNRKPPTPGQPSRASSRHKGSDKPQEATSMAGSVMLCRPCSSGQQLPGRNRVEEVVLTVL